MPIVCRLRYGVSTVLPQGIRHGDSAEQSSLQCEKKRGFSFCRKRLKTLTKGGGKGSRAAFFHISCAAAGELFSLPQGFHAAAGKIFEIGDLDRVDPLRVSLRRHRPGKRMLAFSLHGYRKREQLPARSRPRQGEGR